VVKLLWGIVKVLLGSKVGLEWRCKGIHMVMGFVVPWSAWEAPREAYGKGA